MLFRKLFLSLNATFLLLLLGCFQVSEAYSTKEVFAKYPNKYFIETGSYLGDGIQMALESGFERIYSVELAPHYAGHCRKRFADFPNVTILQGDSAEILPKILKKIDAPATF